MQFTEEEENAIIKSRLHLEKLDEILENNPNISADDFYNEFYEKLGVVYSHHTELGNGMQFYRARVEDEHITFQNVTDISTFSYIPFSLCNQDFPPIQRLNKKGQSIYYASVSPETNYYEIKKNLKPGAGIYLSMWRIKEGANINCYNLLLPKNVYFGAEKNDEMVLNDQIANSILGDYIRTIGEKCLTEKYDDDRKYYIPSLFANHVYNYMKDGKPLYDGILYPSAMVGNGKVYYTNVALTPKCVDNKLDPVWVIKGILHEDMKTITPKFYGIVKDSQIGWHRIDNFIDTSTFEIIGIFNKTEEFIFNEIAKTEKEKKQIQEFTSSLLKGLGESLLKKISSDLDNDVLKINFEHITKILLGKVQSKLTCNLELKDGVFNIYNIIIKGKHIKSGGIIVRCTINSELVPISSAEVCKSE